MTNTFELQTLRFIETLLEYEDLLGDIFQGQSSFSLGNRSTESEKKKAVGQYLGIIIIIKLFE